MVHFVSVYFTPNNVCGSPLLGAASLGRVATTRDRVRFAVFCRGWKTTTPDDGFVSLCFPDTQGRDTNMVHEISCPGVGCADNDACPEGSLCASIERLILSAKVCLSVRTGNRRTREREEWDLVHRIANPCLSPLTGRFVPHNRARGAEADRGQSVCTCVGEYDHRYSQRHAIACTGGCLLGSRISVTRDVARYSLDLFSWCRGYVLSVYIVVADPKLLSV